MKERSSFTSRIGFVLAAGPVLQWDWEICGGFHIWQQNMEGEPS